MKTTLRAGHRCAGSARSGQKRLAVRASVLASVLAMVLSACGGTTTPNGASTGSSGKAGSGKGYTIALSNGFCANSWRKEMLAGLENAIAKEKTTGVVKSFINDCADGDTATQISQINTLIAQHVSAILIIPNSGSALGTVVTKATNVGIKTIVFNLPMTSGTYTAFVGTNPCHKAKLDTSWLVKQVAGKPGGVIGLGGTPGNSYTAEGWACALPIFKAAHVKVLTLRYANWQVSDAKAVTASLIAAYPNISGIWTDGSENALGAEEALQAAGKPLVPTTGDDYNGLMKLWMQVHASNPGFKIGVVPEPPDIESVDALNLAIKALDGQKIAHQNTLSTPLITDAEVPHYVKMNLPNQVFVDTHLSDAQLHKLFG